MRKALGLTLSAMVLTSGALFTASPAAAAPQKAPQADASAEELAIAIAGMNAAGKSQEEVDATLAADYGIVRPEEVESSLRAPGGVGTQSNSNDINVIKPSIYRNAAGAYIVSASYQFSDYQAVENDAGFCVADMTCNVGGLDGFGISLSRPVSSVQSYAMATSGIGDAASGNHFAISTSRMAPTGGSTVGVGYKGQDQAKFNGACCMKDYNVWNGTLVYEIRSIGCGELQAFSQYFHSWDDTTLNSIGIAPWSLSAGWSSSEDKWERGSQASNAVRYC